MLECRPVFSTANSDARFTLLLVHRHTYRCPSEMVRMRAIADLLW
jgi:hypothetical protein